MGSGYVSTLRYIDYHTVLYLILCVSVNLADLF